MTKTAQMTLSDFLLARIAEVEERARAVMRDGGFWTRDRTARMLSTDDGDIPMPTGELLTYFWRLNPRDVLAECEAKRRIVAEHRQYDYGEGDEPHGREDQCPTLRALALPYADHPDYREEWRPDGWVIA